jgi:hypothetical protein
MDGIIIVVLVLLFEPLMHFIVWLSNRHERRKHTAEKLVKGEPL